MKQNPERARSAAYNDCWMRYRGDADWLGFLEVQDFVYSPKGIDSLNALLSQADSSTNLVELTSWPMQESHQAKLSQDHIGERDKLSNRLMVDKYTLRRDFPSGQRSFVRPELIFFVGDANLLEARSDYVRRMKTDWEVLSYTVERDGYDGRDQHRWKPFSQAAEQLSAVLTQRLAKRRL